MTSKRKSTPTEAQCVSLAQNILRDRLCHQRLPEQPVGLESQYRHLLELLRRTAVHGESNSVLIVGPRGAGKTMVLVFCGKTMALVFFCQYIYQKLNPVMAANLVILLSYIYINVV